MNILVMKWIDHLVGIPICALLSPLAWAWRRLRPRRSIKAEDENSLLFIKMMGIGSILLTTPVIRATRTKYPKAKLHLVTFQGNRHMADNLQIFDRVYPLRNKSFLIFFYDTLMFLLHCWKEGYAVAFDFEFFSKFTGILAFLTGARRVVGFTSPLVFRGALQTDPVYFNHYRHVTENFASQARVIGVESKDHALTPMRFTAEEEAFVSAFIAEQKIPAAAKLFLVNVNAGDLCLERRWPAPYFRDLVQSLKKRYSDGWFLFVGSPKEKDYVSEVLAQMGDRTRIVDAAGFSLGQMAALMKRSTLMISNDSGPLHFAEAMELPTVSFFGPAPLNLFSPTGPKHAILYARVECSPCLNYYGMTRPICNGNNICMKNILPSMAEQRIAEHLEKR